MITSPHRDDVSTEEIRIMYVRSRVHLVPDIYIHTQKMYNIMSPSTLTSLEPGQLYLNTKVDQHAVVLGHNGIGWLLQYEDGDIVELGGPGYANTIQDHMVYKPTPPEIEQKRPTLSRACNPTEHVFLTEPVTAHELDSESIRCAKCGLEHEVLTDDLTQFPEATHQLPEKCEHCGDTIPAGTPAKTPLDDLFTCSDCATELNGITWSEYKDTYQ